MDMSKSIMIEFLAMFRRHLDQVESMILQQNEIMKKQNEYLREISKK